MRKHFHNRRAFTLIELLVVIAIIGLLSTIAVVSLVSTRSKARDAIRIADAKQIKTAIQLYREVNGNFPDPGTLSPACAAGSSGWYCLGHGDAGTCWYGAPFHGCTSLDNALAPYIAKIPDDPDPTNNGWIGDAFLYNLTAQQGLVVGPTLHWGMEQVTNVNLCMGGTFAAFACAPTCTKNNKYWCAITIE